MTLKHTFTNTPVSENTLVSMSKKELITFFVQKLKHETEMILELQQLDATQWCFDKGYGRMYAIVIEEFRKEIFGVGSNPTKESGGGAPPKKEDENSRKVESGDVM